jgi:hypothetical protein
MPRKIAATLILLLILLSPVQARANDAFWYDYDGSDLQITVKPIHDDLSIGKDYSFEVTMTNKTEWKLYIIAIDSFLFPDQNILLDDIISESEMSLKPGEKLTVTCTTEVPYNISWYKKDGEFYYDLLIKVEYLIYFSDKEEDWIAASSVAAPRPIQISNLYDGSEMLEMKYVSEDNEAIFERDWDNLNNEEYRARLENTIRAKNVSDAMLQNLIIHGLYERKEPVYTDDVTHSVFLSSNINKVTIKSYYDFISETLPDELTDRHQAIFMIDSKYYAAGLEKNIEMIIGISPEISFYTMKSEDESKLALKLENNTAIDLPNFYFGKRISEKSDTAVLEEDNILALFKKGSSKEYTIESNPRDVYCIGYTTGGYFYSWDVTLDFYDDNVNMHLSNEEYREYIFASEVTISPATAPTSEPTPPQTPHPTDTIAPSPAPSSEETIIEKNEVQKSSSIPLWVLYVLAVAITAGSVLIIVLRKNKRNESKYE